MPKPSACETIFLMLMMIVNVTTGLLSSLHLSWSVSAVHWAWTVLGALCLANVYRPPTSLSSYSSRAYWYMALAGQLVLLEIISLASGFYSMSVECSPDMLVGKTAVSEDCIWNSVYQFHSIYLSFVHIMFLVLLNCCVHDSMKDQENQGGFSLYFNWHTFTAIPFPALFFNMLSIVSMQQYVSLFTFVPEMNQGYIVEAFWWVLKGLALGNIIFNLVIFWWFVQNHREVSMLESVLLRVPYIGDRLLMAKNDYIDVKKGSDAV